jgi:putative FmdB family regulatory protein
MPTYDFICKKCNYKCELYVHKSSNIPICKCGSEMNKLLSFSKNKPRFNVSGFYETDYKANKN